MTKKVNRALDAVRETGDLRLPGLHAQLREGAGGKFTVLRQAMRKRLRAKLKEVKAELRRRMHDPIPEQGAYLGAVLRGHFRYYGVPMNGPALSVFRLAVGWIWCRRRRRRGQRRRINWLRMRGLVSRLLPSPRICHPYPLVRLGVVTQGGSRMR